MSGGSLMRCARRMCRGESVGGKHAPRATIGGRGADGGGTSSLADFAKCGGVRRVVEAPPRWRLSQLVRRQDGGFPCGRDGARPSRGGSAGRLAPPGDDGHAGRVTLPQRARYPAYPILPPPQITPVLLYYAHRKSRRKFNRSEAYEEVM